MKPVILIIEDDTDIREEVVSRLTFENYTVLSAPDGKTGIDKALENNPDLIICDITMPAMDGLTVLSELRSYPDTRDIPFIFLTARVTRSDIRQGMGLGADDYITKPFNYSDLIGAIRARLQRKRDNELSTLKQYAHHLISIQDSQREQTATRLKEQIIQPLSNLCVLVDSIQPLANPALELLLREISSLAHEVSNDADALNVVLWPNVLDHLNLYPAILWIASRFSRETGIQVLCKHDGVDSTISEQTKQNLFFVVQTLLFDVANISNDVPIELNVRQSNEDIVIELSMQDIQNFEEINQSKKLLHLTDVNQRITMLGGMFEHLSSDDIGTIFRLLLPLNGNSITQKQPASLFMENIAQTSMPDMMSRQKQMPENHHKKVMIVDANQLVQQGLTRLVEQIAGFDVVDDVPIEDWVDTLPADVDIDILMLDLEYPHPDIIQFIADVRETYPTISIIILSSHTDNSKAWQLLQNGIEGCILKSEILDELSTALIAVNNGKHYVSQMMSEYATHAFIHNQPQSNEQTDPFDLLTPREKEILGLVASDYQNAEIAAKLVISVRTVETHRANMMRKLNLRSKAEIIKYALLNGIITLEYGDQ